MSDLLGFPIIESPLCERAPTPGEDARRMVRHGYADVLAWLGEDVGPAPGEPVRTSYLIAGSLMVAPDMTTVLVLGFDGVA